jgi:UDP-glucose 4-epimerase
MSERTLFVTGISGYCGKVLLPRLEKNPAIEKIIGVDRNAPLNADAFTKLEFHKMDIRDPEIKTLMQGADTVVHLAFVLMRLPKDQQVDDVNIKGSRNVFEAAASNGVQKLIVTSSVVAYGLHPDNPVPLTEESPLRPNEGLYYSRAKAANEAYLDEFCQRHPEMVVTRLRPCTIVGPTAEKGLMESFLNANTITVKGYNPPYQLVHEEDVASALELAIDNDLNGIYNAAGDNPKTLNELSALRSGKVITLPHWIAKFLMDMLWRTGQSAFAPEWVDLTRYSLAVSSEKLKQAGWQPQHTTAQAFAALLAHYGIPTVTPVD